MPDTESIGTMTLEIYTHDGSRESPRLTRDNTNTTFVTVTSHLEAEALLAEFSPPYYAELWTEGRMLEYWEKGLDEQGF